MRKITMPECGPMDFHVGEELEISGEILCGRDAVLPKIVALYEAGKLEQAGIDLRGAVIFHTAVSVAGIGPTSSNKLEIEASIPALSAAGVRIHLGKGALKRETVDALEREGSCFAVTPPTTALFASRILSSECVAFPELGVEALYRVRVKDFPAIVAIAGGESIFEKTGAQQ